MSSIVVKCLYNSCYLHVTPCCNKAVVFVKISEHLFSDTNDFCLRAYCKEHAKNVQLPWLGLDKITRNEYMVAQVFLQ
jgi:hypothetical protein